MVYLIDGNAYINVAVSVTKSILSRDKSVGKDYYIDDIFSEDKKILREQCRITFRDFCLSYLISIIAPVYKEVDEVHIVFDSKSWRKEYISNFFNSNKAHLEKEFSIKEFEYKGKRRRDENIHLFFEYFQGIISKHLKEKCGVNFHRIRGMEGDDLLARLCKTTNKNVVIYSVDKDLIQLVNGKEKYVIVIFPKQMSKHKKLYVPEKYESGVESDFFSVDEAVSESSLDSVSSKFLRKGYVKYAINSQVPLLEKIIGGDKSDKIPRLYKMTKSKVDKVSNILLEKYEDQLLSKIDELDEEFIDTCIREVSKLNKVSNEDDINSLKEHLIFNIKVIRLSHNMLPENLKNEVENNINVENMYSKFKYSNLLEIKNKSVLL